MEIAFQLSELLRRREGVTYATLVKQTGISYTTAVRWLRAAERVKPLEVDEGHGRGNVNYYRLMS